MLGHSANYFLALEGELQKRGYAPVVVSNLAVEGECFKTAPVQPCFMLRCDEMPTVWPSGNSATDQRAKIEKWHRSAILLDLRNLDSRFSIQRCDHITFNSVRQWQLSGIAEWLDSLPENRIPQTSIILHFTPFPGGSRDAAEAEEYRCAFKRMSCLAQHRQPRFFTDSQVLQREFAELGGREIGLVPIPHSPLGTIESTARVRSQRLTATFLGEARADKGFAMLAPAISQVCAQLGEKAPLFRIHATGAPVDGLIELGAEVIAGQLEPNRYRELLLTTDFVLLPYLTEHYAAQTSGIFAEAVAAGKPTVISEGTWMAEQIGQQKCAAVFQPGHVCSFVEAIIDVVSHYSEYALSAQAMAASWREFHHPGSFVDVLTREEHDPNGKPFDDHPSTGEV